MLLLFVLFVFSLFLCCCVVDVVISWFVGMLFVVNRVCLYLLWFVGHCFVFVACCYVVCCLLFVVCCVFCVVRCLCL